MIPEGIVAAVAAAALLGLRHGVDHDHIAAIADLSGTAPRPARAVRLSMLYGAGHALIVLALGALAIAFGLILPHGADLVMQRVVGFTLVLLGAYVLHALFFGAGHRHLPTRLELLARGWRWLARSFTDAARDCCAAHPPLAPGPLGAFMVGVIHGIGAETPTQLGLFVLTAGVGGWFGGLMCVGAFTIGLLTTNLLMALLSAGVFNLTSARESIYRAVMLASGAYSVALGVILLLGGHPAAPLA
jgi:high-affinity nickel-transport protein